MTPLTAPSLAPPAAPSSALSSALPASLLTVPPVTQPAAQSVTAPLPVAALVIPELAVIAAAEGYIGRVGEEKHRGGR
jgi:hypothetical protein